MTAEKTKAQLVRERFRARCAENANRTIVVPFTLDHHLRIRIKQLQDEGSALEERIADMVDQIESMDKDEADDDLRADGTDLTPDVAALDALRLSLERTTKELDEALTEAREGSVKLIFRPATAAEYQQVLIDVEREVGAIDGSQKSTIEFGDRLTSLCFVRAEVDGVDLEYETLEEFLRDTRATFGSLEYARTMVVADSRAMGSFGLPF